MASTNFNDFTTPAIPAAWLNDVNLLVYQLAGNGVSAPLNDSDVKNNLGITADIAVVNAAVVAGDAATLASATALPGRLLGIQRFTANGTYTPTAGTTRVLVECVAGGGGGGGVVATAAGQSAGGGGGGAGGYSVSFLTSGFSGAAVVVGNAGTAGAVGGAGGAGGTSSFGGATVVANGGNGGQGGGAIGAFPVFVTNAQPGGLPGTGSIIAQGGEGGGYTTLLALNQIMGGRGGNTLYGAGGREQVQTNANGNPATGFGAGGGGAATGASLGGFTGGAGAPGVVIIHEYT